MCESAKLLWRRCLGTSMNIQTSGPIHGIKFGAIATQNPISKLVYYYPVFAKIIAQGKFIEDEGLRRAITWIAQINKLDSPQRTSCRHFVSLWTIYRDTSLQHMWCVSLPRDFASVKFPGWGNSIFSQQVLGWDLLKSSLRVKWVAMQFFVQISSTFWAQWSCLQSLLWNSTLLSRCDLYTYCWHGALGVFHRSDMSTSLQYAECAIGRLPGMSTYQQLQDRRHWFVKGWRQALCTCAGEGESTDSCSRTARAGWG